MIQGSHSVQENTKKRKKSCSACSSI